MAYTNKQEARTDKHGQVLYGMDKELADKAAAKFDPKAEKEAKEWIEACTGEKCEGSLQEWLKSGQVLCKLIKAVDPQTKCPPASKMSAPFKQMENIANYLAACEALNLPAYTTFQTVALYEDKDMMQVIMQIHALGALAQKKNPNLPFLGVKLAEMNVRDFTAEQLAAGKSTQTFLGKGSHGNATQAGMIDYSKNIARNTHVQGLEGNLGKGGEQTKLVGTGSSAGASQKGMVDTSKNIDKLATVK